MRTSITATLAFILSAYAVQAAEFSPIAYAGCKNEIFISGFQRFATLKHNDGYVQKVRYKPTAGALGYQYVNGPLSLGASISFEQGDNKLSESESAYNRISDSRLKTRERTVGFTLFGSYKTIGGWYGKGSLFLGFHNQKLKDGHIIEHTPLGYQTYGFDSGSSKSGTNFAGSLEVGKVFDFGGLRLTPHAGYDYSRTHKDRIRGNVYVNGVDYGRQELASIASQNYHEFPLGVSLAKDFGFGDWLLTPSVDVTMITSVGNIKDENMNYRSGYASRTGSEWKVYGVGAGHWGGKITAGMKVIKSDRLTLDFNYAFEGRKKYYDHRLSASLGFAF